MDGRRTGILTDNPPGEPLTLPVATQRYQGSRSTVHRHLIVFTVDFIVALLLAADAMQIPRTVLSRRHAVKYEISQSWCDI